MCDFFLHLFPFFSSLCVFPPVLLSTGGEGSCITPPPQPPASPGRIGASECVLTGVGKVRGVSEGGEWQWLLHILRFQS